MKLKHLTAASFLLCTAGCSAAAERNQALEEKTLDDAVDFSPVDPTAKQDDALTSKEDDASFD
jgi:ABC-type oligopeptide transport system substrate-binding subunit